MSETTSYGEVKDGKIISFREPRGFDGSVVIAEGVTEICDKAYMVAFCGIKRVVIPSTVKRIGKQAFACCEHLEEITIPEGVEFIGDEAFLDCHSLKKVKISGTVTSIGTGVFRDCGDIEEISVAENNPAYAGAGNCLIDIKKKTLLRGGKNSVIPADGSVTVIGEYAFSNNCNHPRFSVGCEGIAEIVIPEGITKIGKRAFDFNYRLEKAEIPNSVKKIDKYAFACCYELKSLKIGNGLESIGESAFEFSKNLKTEIALPENLAVIEQNAFYKSAITGVTFGKNVGTIGKNAFYECNDLRRVVFCGDVKEIGERAFCGCEGIEELTFSGAVKKIGELSFYGCKKIKRLNFSDGLETVGGSAFECCYELESAVLPDTVKYIGDEAFAFDRKLVEVKLPASVDFMGKRVFKECSVNVAEPEKVGAEGYEIADNVLIKFKGKFKDVAVPSGVTKIAAKAISNKKNVESVTLPSSVTAVANKAIEKCPGLKSIKVESGNAAYGDAGNCLIDKKKKSVILGLKTSVIPDDGSVTAIAANAFTGVEIESIVIPEGVKTIGSGAFKYCNKLKSITLPKTLKSIGPDAFKYCESLESITVPRGVTAIALEAFAYCTGLKQINYNAENCGDLQCGAFDDAGKKSGGVHVIIGANVKRIPSELFNSSSTDTVPNIRQVSFEENSVCESIGESVFHSCAKLKSIKLPDCIKLIDCYAFHGCSSLESANIPKGLTSLGSYAFERCAKLKEAVIPAGLVKLNGTVFKGCGGLERIEVEAGNPVFHSSGNCLIDTENKILMRGCANSVIPSDGSVVRLDNYSFNDCKDLQQIVIPDGVTEIFNNVFENCVNLKSVTIAKTVTYVCNPYFEKCRSLESITADKELILKYEYFDMKKDRVKFSFL